METLTEQLVKVDSYLPVFSGFYGTIWESDNEESSEIEHFNSERERKGLSELPWDAFEFDYEGYKDQVGEGCCNYLESLLSGFITAINYQSISSPKEYNFANDSIHCEFVVSEENKEAIKKYVFQNLSDFTEYIKSRYTSYDGFLSHYSNNATDWVMDIDSALEHEHKLGSILEFIIRTNEGFDFCEDSCELSMYYEVEKSLGVENYEDCMNKEYCTECNEFVNPENFAGVCIDCLDFGTLTGEYVVCACCKELITNKWEKRQFEHKIKHGFISPENVICSDCAVNN